MASHKVNRWKGLLFNDSDYSSIEDQLKEKWKVKKGQLWKLGKHRLYVGNAGGNNAREKFSDFIGYIETQDMGREFPQGIPAELDHIIGVCTDPPYDLVIDTAAKIIGYYANKAVVLASDNMAFGLANTWTMKLDFIWIHDEPRSIGAESRPVYYHNHIVVLTKDKDTRTGWTRPRPNFSSVIYVGTRAYYKNHGKSVFLFKEMLGGFKKWKVIVDPFVGYGT